MSSSLSRRLAASPDRARSASAHAGPSSLRSSAAVPPVSLRAWRPSTAPPGQLAPKPTPDAPFELLAHNPMETVAIAGDCLVVMVGRTLSAHGVLAIQRGFERLELAHDRFGYLSLIEGSRVGTMEPRARALMAEVVGKYTRHIAVASFAVEGSGFRSTAIRSILTAIHVASRAGHPLKVFASLDAALAWYAERYPEHGCDVQTLARVVQTLRRNDV